jgi:hypothetical protein
MAILILASKLWLNKQTILLGLQNSSKIMLLRGTARDQRATGKAGRVRQAEAHVLVKTGKTLSANKSTAGFALAA